MEEKVFIYDKNKIIYFVFRESRKTVSLRVTPKLKIVVKCPREMGEKAVNDFLKKKYYWLKKQIEFFKKFQSNNKKEFISGAAVLYLGRQYKLIIKKSEKPGVTLKGGDLVLSIENGKESSEYNRAVLANWYDQRAKVVFTSRLAEMLKKFNYDFKPILLRRKMDKKWGSFSGQRKLTLNPKLIQAPRECIDYVIIHELCHFKYRDHSQNFYKLLSSKMPGWEKVKEKLEIRFLGE
jgi:predicted metal-dependent hydrolase